MDPIISKLDTLSPSPHVRRPEPTQYACPDCGLPLYRRGLIVACGNGHIWTLELKPLGGAS